MSFQFGEFIVYFFDYTIGCGWWMMVLYVLQLFAIFIIRGRPYHVENVASVLIEPNSCCSKAILSTLAFIWNIVLPIGLVREFRKKSFEFWLMLELMNKMIEVTVNVSLILNTGYFGHRFFFVRPLWRDVRLDDPLRVPLPAVMGQGDRSYDAAAANTPCAIRGCHPKL